MAVRSLLLPLELLEVEIKLPALENVAINTAGLTGARRNAGVQTSRVELLGDLGVDHALLLELLNLGFDGVALLDAFASFIRFFKLLLVQLNVVLFEIPLTEGGGVDHDNSVLDEGLGADKLIVSGVVGAVKNTSLGSHGLGAPSKVAVVATQSASLDVATATAHVDALLGAKLGHSRDSAHFKLSLFLVDRHTAARGSSLVPRVPRNTHTS